MSDYSTLVSSVRRRHNFAEPVTGGADKLSNAAIIEYLSDAFEELTEAMRGIKKYVEFTITTGGVITVTKPSIAAPTIEAVSPQKDSYTFYQVSDAYSYLQDGFENLTSPIDDTYQRTMFPIDVHNPLFQSYFLRDGNNYYTNFAVRQQVGFALLPTQINQTNTVGIRYRGAFVRYSVPTSFTQETGSGLSDFTTSGILTLTDGSTTDVWIKVVADGATSPNTFTLSTDGGASYSGTYNMSTSGTAIFNGISVVAAAITGHTADDEFSIAVTAPSLTDFTDTERRRYPVYSAAMDTTTDLEDTKMPQLAQLAAAEMRIFEDKQLYQNLESQQSWEVPEQSLLTPWFGSWSGGY